MTSGRGKDRRKAQAKFMAAEAAARLDHRAAGDTNGRSCRLTGLYTSFRWAKETHDLIRTLKSSPDNLAS